MGMEDLIAKLRQDHRMEPGCRYVLEQAYERYQRESKKARALQGSQYLIASVERDREYNFICGFLYGISGCGLVGDDELREIIADLVHRNVKEDQL